MIKRLRILLIPFGIVIELFAFGVCWITAFISPSVGKKLTCIAEANLPSIYWYIGERR